MKKHHSPISHSVTDHSGSDRNTVAVYARIDTDDSYMLKAQVKELSAYAAAHPDFIGWKIATYQDTGSFSQSGTQPQLEQLFSDIRYGVIQCVIVKNLSRIARDQVALMHHMELLFSCGTRLIALTEHLDTSSPETMMLLQRALYHPRI